MKGTIQDLLFDSKKGKIKLNEKASIFFFCLLLATFFWFLTSLSKEYTTTLSVPLEYTSYNEEFLLTNTPQESIIIKVRGNGFELLGEQMSLNRKEVKVNLENATTAGKNRYGFSTSSLKDQIIKNLDKDLNFEQIVTDSIFVETEKRASKSVSVVPDLNLSFKSSFNIMDGIRVYPTEVSISGPQQLIDSTSVLKTTTIKQQNLSDSLMINYNLYDNPLYAGLTIEPSKVTIVIPVDKFTEKDFELQVDLRSAIDTIDARTFPNKVKVAFLVPLSNYEQFTSASLAAVVHLNEESILHNKLDVEIEGIPKYAKLLRIEPQRLEYILKQ